MTLHAGSTSSTVCLPFSIASQAVHIDHQDHSTLDMDHSPVDCEADIIPAGSITSVIEITPVVSSAGNSATQQYSTIQNGGGGLVQNGGNIQTITISALDGENGDLEHSGSLPLTLSTLLPLSNNNNVTFSQSSSMPTSLSSIVTVVDDHSTNLSLEEASIALSINSFPTASTSIYSTSALMPLQLSTSSSIVSSLSMPFSSQDSPPTENGGHFENVSRSSCVLSSVSNSLPLTMTSSSSAAFSLPGVSVLTPCLAASLLPPPPSTSCISPCSTSLPSLVASPLPPHPSHHHPPTSRSPLLSISEVTNTLLEHT